MKIVLRVLSLLTLLFLVGCFLAWPLILVSYPLFLATVILALVATALHRQYGWLLAIASIIVLGIVVPGILGPGIQSAVNTSLASCTQQHGSVGCPQSTGQMLLVWGLQSLLLLGIFFVVVFILIYSFRMRTPERRVRRDVAGSARQLGTEMS